jgi:hypothetical protein
LGTTAEASFRKRYNVSKSISGNASKNATRTQKHFIASNNASAVQKTSQHYNKQLKNRSKNDTPLRFSAQRLNNSKILPVTNFLAHNRSSSIQILPAQLKK